MSESLLMQGVPPTMTGAPTAPPGFYFDQTGTLRPLPMAGVTGPAAAPVQNPNDVILPGSRPPVDPAQLQAAQQQLLLQKAQAATAAAQTPNGPPAAQPTPVQIPANLPPAPAAPPQSPQQGPPQQPPQVVPPQAPPQAPQGPPPAAPAAPAQAPAAAPGPAPVSPSPDSTPAGPPVNVPAPKSNDPAAAVDFKQYVTPQAPTGAFAALVPAASSTYGVPEAVMNWVGFRENGWKSGAAAPDGIPTSSGPAMGPWQFKAQTAASMGVDPKDDASSTFGAAKLLRSLYDQTGSWTAAVQKYGTFSTGQGPLKDALLQTAFQQHLSDSGVPDSGAKLPPIQVGSPAVPPGSQPSGGPSTTSALNFSFPDAGNGGGTGGAPAGPPQAPASSGFLTSRNLLRLAAGAAGKKTWGQAIGGAAGGLADGMDEDTRLQLQQQQMLQAQQRIGIDQQNANSQAATGRGQVIDRAQALMQFMPPAQALQIAQAAYNGSGPNGQPVQVPTGNIQGTGGKSTAGDVYYGPDGTPFQERNYPYGTPKFVNMSTGAMTTTLPQGAMRAQDSYFKQNNALDGTAENAAMQAAQGASQTRAQLAAYTSLIPQISPGNSIFSTIKRNASQLLGTQIGDTDPTAIQLAQSVQQNLANARIQMLGKAGLGRVNMAEVNAVKNAGANWNQDPAALKAVLGYQDQQEAMKQQVWDDWNQTRQDDPAAASKGFRIFQSNWTKSHRAAELDTSAVTGTPGAAPPDAGAPAQAPAAPAAAPVMAGKSSTGVSWSLSK